MPEKEQDNIKALLETLIKRGIKDEEVLRAIARVPRHDFIDPSIGSRAYEDFALPIGCGQTISQPYTVAFMTEQLKVQPSHKVLEIGTGSGYQAAVLSHLCREVHSIERIEELHNNTKLLLQRLGYDNIKCYLADGTHGLPDEAPFDGIIVTAAAPSLPKTLIHQLTLGGRMVIPIGDMNSQKMEVIIRLSEDNFKRETHSEFKFVPLIGKHAWSDDDK